MDPPWCAIIRLCTGRKSAETPADVAAIENRLKMNIAAWSIEAPAHGQTNTKPRSAAEGVLHFLQGALFCAVRTVSYRLFSER